MTVLVLMTRLMMRRRPTLIIPISMIVMMTVMPTVCKLSCIFDCHVEGHGDLVSTLMIFLRPIVTYLRYYPTDKVPYALTLNRHLSPLK